MSYDGFLDFASVLAVGLLLWALLYTMKRDN